MKDGWRPSWSASSHRPDAQRAIVERLISALSSSFSDEHDRLINPSAVLTIDGGTHASVVPTPVRGRTEVIDGLRSLMVEETTAALAAINGTYGITLTRAGRVVGVITAEMASGALSTIWAVCNPEKLHHWNTEGSGAGTDDIERG